MQVKCKYFICTFRFSSLRKDQSQRDSTPQRNAELDIKQQYQYQDFQSRLRLDARLWLSSYLALVKSMTGEIRGLGQVKGERICLQPSVLGHMTFQFNF